MSSIHSRGYINQALAWSKNSRSGPVAIEFVSAWDKRIGAVFDWYDQLPCKKFTTLQHRKERARPFLHEYIIVQLVDGSLCRFERTGDPDARKDALSTVGSRAHDLVEHFEASKLSTMMLDETSNVLSNITFPEELDIMSILAICYSIHQGKQTRSYTLQRFNCYFFSWTIVAILTRRLVHWENALSPNTWAETVNRALDSLLELERDSLISKKNQRVLFRICSWLDPESIQPSQFILEKLRQHLLTDKARTTLNKVVSNQVWLRTSDFSDISRWLRDEVMWTAASDSLRDGSPTGSALLAIANPTIGSNLKPDEDAAIRKVCQEECLKAPARVSKYFNELQSGEQQTKLRRKQFESVQQAMYSIPLLLFGLVVVCGFTPKGVPDMTSLLDGHPAGSPGIIRRLTCAWAGVRLRSTVVRIITSQRRLYIRTLLESEAVQAEFAQVQIQGASQAMLEAMVAVLDRLEEMGIKGKDAMQVLLRRTIYLPFNSVADSEEVFEGIAGYGLWNCAGEDIVHALEERLLRSSQSSALTLKYEDPVTTSSDITVMDIGKRIRARISCHAENIGALGLGSSSVVQAHIEEAITQVWKSLPPEHRS